MNPAAYLEMAETEDRHWWFSGRRAISARMIEQLHLPANANILEVGCGTGGNLHMLATFGKVSAFEMDPVARDIAAQKTNGRYDIQPGDCPDHIPFQDRRFDLICMFDVLEHLEEDSKTLTVLKRMLTKDGRIVITVPAHQWLFGAHDVFLHHKRRYSKETLRNTIVAAGLAPVKLSYFNTFLFPLAAGVRLAEKLLGSREATGTDIPPAPINKAFKTLFSAERFLLEHGDLPFGVSLICILR